MESNGVPNKIHCSQETAQELIKHGYEKWLERREDTVVAKGKGALQTYFVNVSQAKSIATKSSVTMSSSNETENDEDIAIRLAKERNIRQEAKEAPTTSISGSPGDASTDVYC